MKPVAILTSLLLQFLLLSVVCVSPSNAASSVTFMEPNSYSHVIPEVGKFGYAVEKMNIYCYKGQEKDLPVMLQSITLNIEIDSESFNWFRGDSPEAVEEEYNNHNSIFSFNLLSRNKKRVLNLNPFNKTCIGIGSAEEYTVSLNLIRLDLVKFALLTGGLIMFFASGKLSRNDAFFYLSGIGLGNVASLLILIWFISKLFPKKPLMYGVLASGWTLAAYFAQIVFDNIQPILVSYQKYVLFYILATSFISFGFCYYKGPPNTIRSQNLIKWGLQVAGLLAIFFSSELREASIGICALSIVLYYFPLDVFGGLKRAWRRRFPPKRKLLSKEEYEEQARIETEKALLALRDFVKSPKSNQWKLVKNLTDPMRFASFVEGDEHVTLDETMEYESILHTMELSDDDDSDLSDETIDESIVIDENFQRINKSKLNGNLTRYKSFNNTKSSTPNAPLRQQNGNRSRVATRRNNTFEISDDE